MKRTAALLCLLSLLCLLTGCMNSVRLNQRGVVRAIGIDLDEDGGYRAVMQVREAVGGVTAGANQAAEGGQNSMVEDTGDTLVDLFVRASATRGRQLFLGNVKAIVIGESVARDGIDEIIGFFNANHQLSPNTAVMVARGDAGELIRAGQDDPVLSADGLVDIVESAQKIGFAPRGRLMDIAGALNAENGVGVLPLLDFKAPPPAGGTPAEEDTSSEEEPPSESSQAEQEPQEEKPKLSLAGSALFSGERMVVTLDQSETRGLAWMKNAIKTTSLSVADETLGKLATATHSQKAKLELEMTGEVPVVDITLRVRSTSMELKLRPGVVLDEQAFQYASALQEAKIRDEIEQMISKTQREGLDVLGVSRLTRQSYPDYYEQHREKWAETIAGAGYNVTVKCEIDRTGVANREA